MSVLCRANVQVPLQPAAPGQQLNLSPDMLTQLRGYIAVTRARNTQSFQITEDADKHAQQDFVRCRKADKKLSGDDFHRWLTLARLLALRCDAQINHPALL